VFFPNFLVKYAEFDFIYLLLLVEVYKASLYTTLVLAGVYSVRFHPLLVLARVYSVRFYPPLVLIGVYRAIISDAGIRSSRIFTTHMFAIDLLGPWSLSIK